METHTSGNYAMKIAKKRGLDKWFIVDASGQSGDIWYLWDSSLWKVEVLSSSSPFIHMNIKYKDSLVSYPAILRDKIC